MDLLILAGLLALAFALGWLARGDRRLSDADLEHIREVVWHSTYRSPKTGEPMTAAWHLITAASAAESAEAEATATRLRVLGQR